MKWKPTLAWIILFLSGLLFVVLSQPPIASAVQTAVQIGNGGTGTSTTPSYGDLLIGGKNGEYDFVASSTLGGGSSAFSTTSTAYWLTQQTTSNLAEGSNLYYTPTRVYGILSSTSSLPNITTLSGLSLPTAQLTGTLSILNGGTGTSTQVTNGVNYFDGTKITSSPFFNDTGSAVTIGTTTPLKTLTVESSQSGGIARFLRDVTSPITGAFYGTQDISLNEIGSSLANFTGPTQTLGAFLNGSPTEDIFGTIGAYRDGADTSGGFEIDPYNNGALTNGLLIDALDETEVATTSINNNQFAVQNINAGDGIFSFYSTTGAPEASLSNAGLMTLYGNLSVKGAATTTGNQYVSGNLDVGTSTEDDPLEVACSSGYCTMDIWSGSVQGIFDAYSTGNAVAWGSKSYSTDQFIYDNAVAEQIYSTNGENTIHEIDAPTGNPQETDLSLVRNIDGVFGGTNREFFDISNENYNGYARYISLVDGYQGTGKPEGIDVCFWPQSLGDFASQSHCDAYFDPSGVTALGNFASSTTGTAYGYKTNGAAVQLGASSTAPELSVYDTANTASSNIALQVMNTTGYVGIGTQFPTALLDILGDYPLFKVRNTDTAQYSGAGFDLINSNVSGGQAGYTFYAGINDVADTQGFLSLDETNASGAGTGHVMVVTGTSTVNFYPFVGISTTTPGSLFSVGGVANLTAATSTFYSSGGINLEAGCFAINGTCIGGTGGSSASSTLLSDNNTFSGNNVFTKLLSVLGLTDYASSTIGASGANGLTISGNATTTGAAYFASNILVATDTQFASSPMSFNDSPNDAQAVFGNDNVNNWIDFSAGRAEFGFDATNGVVEIDGGPQKGFRVSVNGTTGTFPTGTVLLDDPGTAAGDLYIGTSTMNNAGNTALYVTSTSSQAGLINLFAVASSTGTNLFSVNGSGNVAESGPSANSSTAGTCLEMHEMGANTTAYITVDSSGNLHVSQTTCAGNSTTTIQFQ